MNLLKVLYNSYEITKMLDHTGFVTSKEFVSQVYNRVHSHREDMLQVQLGQLGGMADITDFMTFAFAWILQTFGQRGVILNLLGLLATVDTQYRWQLQQLL